MPNTCFYFGICTIKKRVTAFSTQYKGKLNSISPDELLDAVTEMENDKAGSLLLNPLVQKYRHDLEKLRKYRTHQLTEIE
jgi:oligoendopeptidase F